MRTIYLIATCLLIIACEKKAKLPGFSVTDSGLEYKLIALGDENNKIKSGDYLVANISVSSLKGKPLSKPLHQLNSNPIQVNKNASLLMEGLSKLVIGDSAAFILPSKEIKPYINLDIADTQTVVVHIRVSDTKTKTWFDLEEKFPGLATNFPEETEELYRFFDAVTPISMLAIGDMFYISTEQGNGDRAATGDVVNLDFEGFFSTGEKFDSTIDRGEPFEYTIGEMGQVLLGFNIGVRQLTEGGEAWFVLPSHMAFEERGSTDGTVPPNVTVIYRVKLNKIIKNES